MKKRDEEQRYVFPVEVRRCGKCWREMHACTLALCPEQGCEVCIYCCMQLQCPALERVDRPWGLHAWRCRRLMEEKERSKANGTEDDYTPREE